MSELKKDNSKLKSRQNDHQVDYRLQITIAERDVDIENQGDVYTKHFLEFCWCCIFLLWIQYVRVADLEQTLSIVQTAQEWTLGKGWDHDWICTIFPAGCHVMSREQFFNLGLWLRIYNYSLLDSQRLPYLIHNPCDGSSGSTLCRHDAGASHANARDQSAVGAGRLCEIYRVSHFFPTYCCLGRRKKPERRCCLMAILWAPRTK